MELLHPKAYLKQFAFDPAAEAFRLNKLSPKQRIQELNQQIESHENHVRNDQAVSVLYTYWMDYDGEIYTSSEKKEINNVKNQIDFRERNGLFYEGLLLAAGLAQKNQNQLVLLYSPAGKKLFDDTPVDPMDPNELEVLKTPYDLGQLYFLYYDGNKLNNVAVSIDHDGNPWLQELFPILNKINSINNEELKIQSFLTNLQLVGHLESFFNRTWSHNHLIFENVKGRKFFLDEVLQTMRVVFAEKTKSEIKLDSKTIQALQKDEITPDDVIRAYLLPMYHDMRANNISFMRFGGGCAGTGTGTSELEEILGISSSISSFSSEFRQMRQNSGKNSEKKWTYHEGECNLCHKKPAMVGPCNICKDCEKGFD